MPGIDIGTYLGDILRTPFGNAFGGGVWQMLNPQTAIMNQYKTGKDILELDRMMGGKRLGQEMAGRGMYRQGPMSQGLKGLEGDYQRALTQMFGGIQQGALSRQQQMLQLLWQMAAQGKQQDLQRQAMQGSWLGGLGDLLGGIVPFGKWMFGGRKGGKGGGG